MQLTKFVFGGIVALILKSTIDLYIGNSSRLLGAAMTSSHAALLS